MWLTNYVPMVFTGLLGAVCAEVGWHVAAVFCAGALVMLSALTIYQMLDAAKE